MYHNLSLQPDPRNDLSISTAAFTQQMAYLKSKGYVTISLRQLSNPSVVPRRACVITFDDAYTSVLELAKPVLDELGFMATVFVVAAAVGKNNFWDEGKDVEQNACLDRAALQSLLASGWEIGAHSMTHADLTRLNDDALRLETAGARSALAEQLDYPVHAFCYPYGAWNAAAQAAVQQAGFVAACAISPGTSSVTANLWALRRVYVKRSDSLGAFRRKISGWYLRYRAWRKR